MCFAIFIAFVIAGVECLPKAMDGVTECGVEASTNLIHHNPWLVYLEFYRRDRLTEIRCAATLIDSTHLLTAAHCVKKSRSKLVARLGEYDVSQKKDCVQGVCADPVIRVQIDQVIINPDYDGSDHDLAVLRLKEPVQFTEFIQPICLPASQSSFLPEKAMLSAAGWGEIPSLGSYSDLKKIVPLPLHAKDMCRKAYANSKIPEHIICAGGIEGVDTCRGDSGGPLTFVGDKVVLVGVTSAGSFHCGTKGIPAMYSSVFDHLDWIKKVISV